jgi:hypothetical protein
LALALPALAFSCTSWKVEHQQGLLQRLGGDGADFGIVQQFDQRLDVVAAEHGAEQFGGARGKSADSLRCPWRVRPGSWP